MARKPGKNAIAFILITMVIDSVGFGLIIPVLPALLKELINADAASAARWGGYLAVTYALMNFLAGPTLGNLSDRFGRRPVLLISLGTLAIDFLIMGFAQTIGILFLGRFLAGIGGATYATANAYIVDVTPPEKRAQAFGLVGAAFGIGFIIGPAIGGLLGGIDARAPFFAAAALAAVNTVYGYFVLPESLAKEKRRPFDIKRANPFGAFVHFSKLPNVRWFLLAVLIFSFAHFVYPSTWNYHADARYGWGSTEIGWSLMVVGIGFAVVQAGLIGPIIKRFGPFRTAMIGLCVNAVAFAGFAFASTPTLLYLIIPFSALGAITTPAINSLMANVTPDDAQGELQGANSSVQALANIISPIMMTQAFAYFASDGAPVEFYGAAFLLAAMLTIVALVPFLVGVRINRNEIAKAEQESNQAEETPG